MSKVSIFIPAYNQENLVVQAVQSALSQTYGDLEVVVSDDNSTDNIQETLKVFLNDKRFKYFKNEENIGRVANYRKCLFELVTGDFCLCLDGDDYLTDNNYIQEAIEFIKQNNLVCTFAKQKVFFEKDNSFIVDKVNDDIPALIEGKDLFLKYCNGYSIPHLTTLYNRKIAMEIGYYKEDILSSDWDSVLRLMLCGKVGFINKCVGVWRKHQKNESRSENFDKIINNLKFILSPYQYAKQKHIFTDSVIENWKNKMLKRYFFKLLIRFKIQHNAKYYHEIKNFCKENYLKIYKMIFLNPAAVMVLMFISNKEISGFIFKYIFKLQSFSKDLT